MEGHHRRNRHTGQRQHQSLCRHRHRCLNSMNEATAINAIRDSHPTELCHRKVILGGPTRRSGFPRTPRRARKAGQTSNGEHYSAARRDHGCDMRAVLAVRIERIGGPQESLRKCDRRAPALRPQGGVGEADRAKAVVDSRRRRGAGLECVDEGVEPRWIAIAIAGEISLLSSSRRSFRRARAPRCGRRWDRRGAGCG